MDREIIGALVFIIFILIPILFMIGWVLKGYNEPTPNTKNISPE
jgi:hypothetical protein